MATQLAPCPQCRQMNAYTAVDCIECGQRLPWGDTVLQSKIATQSAQAQAVAANQAAQQAAAPPAYLQDLKFCDKCKTKIPKGASFCAKCGTPWGKQGAADDAPSFAAGLLGFIIPLGGLIFWLVQKASHPQRAASAGKGAIWGTVTTFFIALLTIIGLSILGNKMKTDTAMATAGDPPTTQIAPAPATNPAMAPAPTLAPANRSEEFELLIHDGLNKNLRDNNSSLTCTSVSLIKENEHKYTGFADVSDGSKVSAEAIVDDDGKVLWKTAF